MICGHLVAEDYEDRVAADPRIDRLRSKMTVIVHDAYTQDLRNPAKRSNAHAIQVRFKDGAMTERIEVEYPLGHPKRRAEGLPLLVEKFERNLARCYAPKRQQAILNACADQRRLESLPVHEFVGMFALP